MSLWPFRATYSTFSLTKHNKAYRRALHWPRAVSESHKCDLYTQVEGSRTRDTHILRIVLVTEDGSGRTQTLCHRELLEDGCASCAWFGH